MVRELLGTSAVEQLRATTDHGDTALHLAARRRDLDMVRILVDYGTNVDLPNVRTSTPLDVFKVGAVGGAPVTPLPWHGWARPER